MSQSLSPAAQAVLDAFRAVPDLRDCPSIAAALRAVADLDETLFDVSDKMVPAVRAVRTNRILALAAELEGSNG